MHADLRVDSARLGPDESAALLLTAMGEFGFFRPV
jgi:hypothetical protein